MEFKVSNNDFSILDSDFWKILKTGEDTFDKNQIIPRSGKLPIDDVAIKSFSITTCNGWCDL